MMESWIKTAGEEAQGLDLSLGGRHGMLMCVQLHKHLYLEILTTPPNHIPKDSRDHSTETPSYLCARCDALGTKTNSDCDHCSYNQGAEEWISEESFVKFPGDDNNFALEN